MQPRDRLLTLVAAADTLEAKHDFASVQSTPDQQQQASNLQFHEQHLHSTGNKRSRFQLTATDFGSHVNTFNQKPSNGDAVPFPGLPAVLSDTPQPHYVLNGLQSTASPQPQAFPRTSLQQQLILDSVFSAGDKGGVSAVMVLSPASDEQLRELRATRSPFASRPATIRSNATTVNPEVRLTNGLTTTLPSDPQPSVLNTANSKPTPMAGGSPIPALQVVCAARSTSNKPDMATNDVTAPCGMAGRPASIPSGVWPPSSNKGRPLPYSHHESPCSCCPSTSAACGRGSGGGGGAPSALPVPCTRGARSAVATQPLLADGPPCPPGTIAAGGSPATSSWHSLPCSPAGAQADVTAPAAAARCFRRTAGGAPPGMDVAPPAVKQQLQRCGPADADEAAHGSGSGNLSLHGRPASPGGTPRGGLLAEPRGHEAPHITCAHLPCAVRSASFQAHGGAAQSQPPPIGSCVEPPSPPRSPAGTGTGPVLVAGAAAVAVTPPGCGGVTAAPARRPTSRGHSPRGVVPLGQGQAALLLPPATVQPTSQPAVPGGPYTAAYGPPPVWAHRDPRGMAGGPSPSVYGHPPPPPHHQLLHHHPYYRPAPRLPRAPLVRLASTYLHPQVWPGSGPPVAPPPGFRPPPRAFGYGYGYSYGYAHAVPDFGSPFYGCADPDLPSADPRFLASYTYPPGLQQAEAGDDDEDDVTGPPAGSYPATAAIAAGRKRPRLDGADRGVGGSSAAGSVPTGDDANPAAPAPPAGLIPPPAAAPATSSSSSACGPPPPLAPAALGPWAQAWAASASASARQYRLPLPPPPMPPHDLNVRPLGDCSESCSWLWRHPAPVCYPPYPLLQPSPPPHCYHAGRRPSSPAHVAGPPRPIVRPGVHLPPATSATPACASYGAGHVSAEQMFARPSDGSAMTVHPPGGPWSPGVAWMPAGGAGGPMRRPTPAGAPQCPPVPQRPPACGAGGGVDDVW